MIGFHEKLLIEGQGTGQAAPELPEPRQGDIGQDAPVFPWPSPPALCSPDFVSQIISQEIWATVLPFHGPLTHRTEEGTAQKFPDSVS